MSEDQSQKSENSSQLERIVPMQMIAYLENDRKNKISIPHRLRVKSSVITIRNNLIKLDKSGRCTIQKSPSSEMSNIVELQAKNPKKLTCAQCNTHIFQTNSGHLKPYAEFQNNFSFDSNSKVQLFKSNWNYCNKKSFENIFFNNRGAGDAPVEPKTKAKQIGRWLKANWVRLTKDFKFTSNEATNYISSSAVAFQNDVACNTVHLARPGQFPLTVKPIQSAPVQTTRRAYSSSSSTEGTSGAGCCGAGRKRTPHNTAPKCYCCKLACKLLGCTCDYCIPCVDYCADCSCLEQCPEPLLRLNPLDRAHLQHLYNTPCSSVQFSHCNCALEEAVVKEHTTAAHYFAHKGLREVDRCSGEGRRRSSASFSGWSGELGRHTRDTQESHMELNLQTGAQYYDEDDDCCCKCCNQAMVSIECQTESRLYIPYQTQTEDRRKKCRPCCKCCRCNRIGGQCHTDCKHLTNKTVDSPKDSPKDGTKSITLPRGDIDCCNKCTGISNRIRGGAHSHTSCANCRRFIKEQHMPRKDSLIKRNVMKLLGMENPKRYKNVAEQTINPVCNICRLDSTRRPYIGNGNKTKLVPLQQKDVHIHDNTQRHKRHHRHEPVPKTRVYRTHSTQCCTNVQEKGTSCLADFRETAEMGDNLCIFPPIKAHKYKQLYDQNAGKFKSPITGREYNLKLETVNYNDGLTNSDLPKLLELDDALDNLQNYERISMNTNVQNYKENNDLIINAICDAILLAKDIGATENTCKTNTSTTSTSNTFDSLSENDAKVKNTYPNDALVFSNTNICMWNNPYLSAINIHAGLEQCKLNIKDTIPLYINSNQHGKSDKSSRIKSSIKRSKTKLKAFSSKSTGLNLCRNESSARSLLKSIVEEKLSNRVSKHCEELTKPLYDNDIDLIEHDPKENFIGNNLCCFENNISDTYSIIQILDRYKENLSYSSTEQIENVIDYISCSTKI